jgi:hypothetical protein
MTTTSRLKTLLATSAVAIVVAVPGPAAALDLLGGILGGASGATIQDADAGGSSTAYGGQTTVNGNDAQAALNGNAISGPGVGGSAFNVNQGGFGAQLLWQDADAGGDSYAAGGPTNVTGEDASAILNGNAISGPAIGGVAVNINTPYGDGLLLPSLPDDDPSPTNPPVADVGNPPTGSLPPGAPASNPPIGNLADMPPNELRNTLSQIDDRDVDTIQQSCWSVLKHEELYDPNTVRVCEVVTSL